MAAEKVAAALLAGYLDNESTSPNVRLWDGASYYTMTGGAVNYGTLVVNAVDGQITIPFSTDPVYTRSGSSIAVTHCALYDSDILTPAGTNDLHFDISDQTLYDGYTYTITALTITCT